MNGGPTLVCSVGGGVGHANPLGELTMKRIRHGCGDGSSARQAARWCQFTLKTLLALSLIAPPMIAIAIREYRAYQDKRILEAVLSFHVAMPDYGYPYSSSGQTSDEDLE